MTKKRRCIFCDIVAGKAEAYKVFEDERSICILDIHPFTRGHCLVIPKRHVRFWHELSTEETASLFETARTVANRMMKTLSPDFVFMYARGRRIPHTHVFLVPAYEDDVLDRFFRALEKFQESPAELAEFGSKEKLTDAMKLLRGMR